MFDISGLPSLQSMTATAHNEIKAQNVTTTKLKVKSRSHHYQYKNEPVLPGGGGYHITSLIV